MSDKMNTLQDIQCNTSEFNIKFHMKSVIALAILAIFLVPDNKKIIEDLVNMKIQPIGIKKILIADEFEQLVSEYLKTDMYKEED